MLENKYPDAALFLHAGDWGLPASGFDHWISVRGNNDLSIQRDDLPDSRIVLADGWRILLIHGHQAAPSERIRKLVMLAKKENCRIVVYGHSHIADITEKDGILLINPGSLRRSRDGRGASFAILNLEGEKAEAKIHYWIKEFE